MPQSEEERKEEIRRMVREEAKRMPGGPRHAGITIICVLGLLLSILMLLLGVSSLAFSGMVQDISISGTFGDQTASATFTGFGSLFILLGLISLIIGIVGLAAFYMLLKMKKIGWIIVTILGIISIIQSLVLFSAYNIPGIAIWVIIIGYLWTKRGLFA